MSEGRTIYNSSDGELKVCLLKDELLHLENFLARNTLQPINISQKQKQKKKNEIMLPLWGIV